jgi:membrane-associated phospholipid phosphatase
VRRGLRWSNIERADAVSNWMGFGVVPALAFSGVAAAALVDDRAAGVWSDLGIVLEATVIAANLNQLVKMSVGRERPFVHALPEDEKPQTSRPSDNNLSFYSGHTSPAFTLAVSASMVATLRGYRLAKVVWATSLPLAGLTGYLRIAADRHYFTDVMTGAALGSAIGLLVPWLHRRSPGSTAVTVSASSRQLLVEWRL